MKGSLLVRTSLLGLVFLAMTSLLVKGLLQASESSPQQEGVNLPKNIPLENWDWVNRLQIEQEDHLKVWRYEYQKNDQSLEVDTYFLPSGNGNVSRFLQIYQEIPPATVNIKIEYQEERGFYGFFFYDEKPQIAACINPYGQTTVTSQQFAQNVSKYGFQFQRVLPWLLGTKDLIDRSCLFTIIRFYPDETNTKLAQNLKAYPELRQAWFYWYDSVKKLQ